MSLVGGGRVCGREGEGEAVGVIAVKCFLRGVFEGLGKAVVWERLRLFRESGTLGMVAWE